MNLHKPNRIRLILMSVMLASSLCSARASRVDDLIRWSSQGDVKKVEALLKQKVNPNAKNDWGYTALMWAAHRGHVEVCKQLLAKGAKPDVQDKSGRTALMFATSCGMIDIGGSIEGSRWLHHYPPIARLLLDAGANPNLRDKQGNTALAYRRTLWREFGEVCTVLLSRGAKIDLLPSQKEAFLVEAAREGESELVRFILTQKPSQADVDTALLEACEKSVYRSLKPGMSWVKESHRIIQLLLEAGADPNTTNKAKETPLMLIHHSNLPAAEPTRWLIKHGAKVEVADARGFTPLMYAVATEHRDSVSLLLENGANPNVWFFVKGVMMTPLALAEDSGNADIIELLKKAGAKE
jgi:uncharacterized protein